MLRALAEYQIHGIRTTIPFHRWLLRRPEFARAEFDTGTIDRDFAGLKPEVDEEHETVAISGAVIHAHEMDGGAVVSSDAGNGMNPWKLAGRRRRSR